MESSSFRRDAVDQGHSYRGGDGVTPTSWVWVDRTPRAPAEAFRRRNLVYAARHGLPPCRRLALRELVRLGYLERRPESS
jgi:hypothetical protein